jgi:hypothetical protein
MTNYEKGNPAVDALPEKDLAGYFEENKDNPALWQKKPRKIRSRRGQGPSSVFTLRLTAEELEELALAASARGVSLTEFIRNTALKEARLIEVDS